MKDTEIVHFFSSEEIFEKAKNIFNREKQNIESYIFPIIADIQHIGSCAVPGALAKFDVDIQIRVKDTDFDQTISILSKKYNPKYNEIWKHGLAIFDKNEECQIDIALTIIDSPYDEYYKLRDYFIANPDVLEEFNNLKRQFEGRPYSEYKKAKKEFLGENGKVRFLN